MLLYDGLMSKAKEKLPATPEMGRIFELIHQVEGLARDIRRDLGLPSKE